MREEQSRQIKPLTKCKTDGELYRRLEKNESQINEILNLKNTEALALAKKSSHRDDEYLFDETIVYLLRNADHFKDAEFVGELYQTLNRRIVKILRRFWNSLNNKADFDELVQATELKIIEKIFDEQSDQADYAEVLFTKFVALEGYSILKKLHTRENRDNEFLIRSNGDDESDDFEIEDKQISIEEIFILREAIEKLPNDTKQIIYLIKDGFQIESKDENEITISKILGKTSRTIRNRLADARSILADFSGDSR